MLDGPSQRSLVDGAVERLEEIDIGIVQPHWQGQDALLPEHGLDARVEERALAHPRLGVDDDQPLCHYEVRQRAHLARSAEEETPRELIVAERPSPGIPSARLVDGGQE